MDMQTLTIDTAENVASIVSLPSSITIETVEKLASDLHALALPPAASLTLDASLTEILTTPGVQLLVSLDKMLADAGGALWLHNARETLADSFRMLGLETHFTQWSKAHE